MTTEPVTPAPPEGPGGPRPWVRPVALVASCLVIGFVGGWVVRGDDGPVTVLAPAQPEDDGSADGGGATTAPGSTTGTTGTAPTTTAAEAPEPPPDRADIALGVLNGTGEAGLAARTAGQAESLGYVGVATGNAPGQSGPSVVYFRAGQRPAARRVARDLQIAAVRALPGGTSLGTEVPEAADVIVVLGPG
ncbi:LytR C-terminal domain-containing protein [Miltoncostaea oceani]|jgi:hypothetical protein|uniref:LytR C-terminal domain-containing protein n=1 Tax=Miltoncostaea oceani TaxID=2843216 RepID=UPI001C3DC0A4|nr:LytR C-terminal domain-containing protein [Miltoncostaea oceani]